MTAAPRHCPARCELEELRAQTIEQGKAGGRRGGTRPAQDAHGRPRDPLASACAMNWVLVRLLRGACGPAAGALIGRFAPDAGDLAGYGAPGRSPRIAFVRVGDARRTSSAAAASSPDAVLTAAPSAARRRPPASSPARITSRNGSQRSDPSPSTGASASGCALSKMRVRAASRSWLSSAAPAASSQSRRNAPSGCSATRRAAFGWRGGGLGGRDGAVAGGTLRSPTDFGPTPPHCRRLQRSASCSAGHESGATRA